MKKITLALGAASIAILVLIGSVAAAGPPTDRGRDQLRDRDAMHTVLGLTAAQVAELRQDGLTLAQIAERQHVDPQRLVDILMERWTERLQVRIANGAITADQAAQLRTQLETRARNMVYATPTATNAAGLGNGAALGAGPRAGAVDATSIGTMERARAGTAARGTAAGQANGQRAGAGTGARGSGAGTGTCDGSGHP